MAIASPALFAQLRLQPKISKSGALTRYNARNIDIFVGDIFKLTRKTLGRIDAIYDRAAFVALPEDMRRRYATHLTKITNTARRLLVTYDYDQTVIPGPPFSIGNPELAERYGKSYDLRLLTSAPLQGGLKGKCPATENVWLLKAK